jgi:hypothetical protein
MLAEFAGRKPLCVSFATEPRPGSECTQTTVTTTQTATIR